MPITEVAFGPASGGVGPSGSSGSTGSGGAAGSTLAMGATSGADGRAADAADAMIDPGHDPRSSTRRLDAVGVETVLGAMIEQKRRSQPAPHEVEDISSPPSNTSSASRASEDGDARAGAQPASDSYLKAR